MTIQELLDKYEKSYVPGEKRSPHYDHRIKEKAKLKNRMHLKYTLFPKSPFEEFEHF